MAEFLCRRRPRKHQRTYRHRLWHGSHRGALCPLRCAFGPRVSGWSRADRAALLHELGVAGLRAEEVSGPSKRSNKKRNDGAPGVVARPPLCRTGETPVAPSLFLNSNLEFRLREFTRCPRSRPLPSVLPACSELDSVPAFSDLSFRGCVLRRRP